MKRVLILFKLARPKLGRYLNEALKGEAEIFPRLFSDVILEIEPGKVEVKIGKDNLADFDLVHFRWPGLEYLNLSKTLAFYCDSLGVSYFNQAWGRNLVIDKFGDLVRLATKGLPVPASFYCDKSLFSQEFKHIVAKFGSPFVAKDLLLHQGRGVFLIKEKEDLTKIKDASGLGLIFQKFYPNDFDYRLLVLEGKVMVAEKRIRRGGEFRNSVHLGAKEEFLQVSEVPRLLKAIAVKAAQILDLDFAGVDILVDKTDNRPYLLEVNRYPGFTYDLKVSPELPAVATFFRQKLKDV